MPETPEAFWERTRDALRQPAVEQWDSWPFAGGAVPRALDHPVAEEPARHGEGGVDCRRCREGDAGSLWSDENWIVRPASRNGLPIVVLLETRAHVDFPELSDERAAELGPLMLRVHRAVLAAGEIGRVHVCRFGEGSEHFHLWFIARPARMPQLASSFAAIWDDVLPEVPHDVWQESCERVRAALNG